MITNLREILLRHDLKAEKTVYRESKKSLFSYSLVSGDFYDVRENRQGERKIRFKNSVNISDFQGIVKKVPKLCDVQLKERENIPFFTSNLKKLQEALQKGRRVAVEGGPCLFGVDEVDVQIFTKDGKKAIFDYCSGKRYAKGQDVPGEHMESFIREKEGQIERVLFQNKKRGITSQEYESIQIVFEIAKCLDAIAVIPLPDMSYAKYLEAIFSNVPKEKREQIMREFRAVSWEITDWYVKLIEEMKKEYPTVECFVLHERDKASCEQFYEKRAPYIEKNKIIRMITNDKLRLESVKDYISMPALPFYLFGITDIVEVDSVDETDSYRKCAKAHKGVLSLSCILYPERLSEDGKNTIYHAKQEYKDYLTIQSQADF